MPARQTVLVGDALTRLRELADGSVQVVATSPPYYGLRDYATGTWTGGDPACDHQAAKGKSRYDYAMPETARTGTHGGMKPGTDAARWADTCPKCGARREDEQLGQEARPDCLGWATGQPCGECYVCHLVAVFREVRRVLRDDGTLWLNLAPSYAANRSYQIDGAKQIAGSQPANGSRVPTGYKPKDLILTPHLVALALQADGWYLRAEIIWAKTAPLPESVTDRPTRSHEQIFLFSKSERYYFDQDTVREPLAASTLADKRNGTGRHTQGKAASKYFADGAPDPAAADQPSWYRQKTFVNPETGRNLRSVWTLGPEPNLDQFCAACHTLYTGRERRQPGQPCRCGATDKWVAHFASFPQELPRRAIKAGSSAMGCCPKCRAPWARIVATPDMTDRPRRSANAKTAAINGEWSGTSSAGQAYQEWRNANPNVTTAWRPTCTCPGLDGDAPWPDVTMHPDGLANWPTIPCTVLDPFVGSGTTLLVAQELGRAGIGIDLRPEYAALTQARLARAGQQPALLEVADV